MLNRLGVTDDLTSVTDGRRDRWSIAIARSNTDAR